jgi:hypothetical protein
VKSYLECGRAFRIETVVNDTADLFRSRNQSAIAGFSGLPFTRRSQQDYPSPLRSKRTGLRAPQSDRPHEGPPG